jgi:hypothetical protein
MKNAIPSVNTDRQSNSTGTAGKLQDPVLFDDMETNRIEGMFQASAKDNQLLAVFAPREMWLRKSMCESKNRYDKRGARTMLNAFARSRGRHGRPENLRAYPCPFCAGWHLTKTVCEISELTLVARPIQYRKN